jgi:hypothetical protein
MMRADEVMLFYFVDIRTAILNDPLSVTRFIETTELLRVQGPKNNIKAVGDYLRADVPF